MKVMLSGVFLFPVDTLANLITDFRPLTETSHQSS